MTREKHEWRCSKIKQRPPVVWSYFIHMFLTSVEKLIEQCMKGEKISCSFLLSTNEDSTLIPEFALLTLGEPNCGGGLPRDSSPSLAILWSCSLCSCWIILSMLGLCSWAGWSPGEGSTGGTGAGSSGWGWSSTRASRSPITSCEPEEKISLLCSTVHGTYHNTSDEIIDLYITCFK